MDPCDEHGKCPDQCEHCGDACDHDEADFNATGCSKCVAASKCEDCTKCFEDDSDLKADLEARQTEKKIEGRQLLRMDSEAQLQAPLTPENGDSDPSLVGSLRPSLDVCVDNPYF